MTTDEKLEEILEKLQDIEDKIDSLGDQVINLGGGTGYQIETYPEEEE